MVPIPCVFYEPTGLIRRYLRRFRFSDAAVCAAAEISKQPYCNAEVFLDDMVPVLTPEGCVPVQYMPYDDPRWPKMCDACGRRFSAEVFLDDPPLKPDVQEPWQVYVDWLFRSHEQGEQRAACIAACEGAAGSVECIAACEAATVVVPLRELPLGAIWEQDFGHGPDSIHFLSRVGVPGGAPGTTREGAYAPHLFIRTPGGDWDMDTPSDGGDGWMVTGTPPKITARPSIHFKKTNGWHGWLTDGILTQA